MLISIEKVENLSEFTVEWFQDWRLQGTVTSYCISRTNNNQSKIDYHKFDKGKILFDKL